MTHETEFSIHNLFPADAWDCLRSTVHCVLADCSMDDLRPSKGKDCAPWIGKNILVQRVVVRVGYERQPLDMPTSLIAQRIAAIAKSELNIPDLYETVRENTRKRAKHFSSNWDLSDSAIEETIVRMFATLVYPIRHEWMDQGKAERLPFVYTLKEPYLVTVNDKIVKKVGTRWPGGVSGWDEPEYYGPTLSERYTLNLLLCKQYITWSPTQMSTSLMVHPDDVIREMPEANSMHKPDGIFRYKT